MEIENRKNAEFVSLLGATNFEHKIMEHIRSRTLIRVKQQSKQYQGILRFESGINTNDGTVVVEVAL